MTAVQVQKQQPIAVQRPTKQLTAIQTNLRMALAGAICASATHLVTVPLDVVKTTMQVDPLKRSAGEIFAHIRKEEGVKGLTRGWGPTLWGYAIQGACKFMFYEIFKHKAEDILGTETVAKHKLGVYLAAGALAETIASTALCPWEAVRIRMVSSREFAPNMVVGFSRIARTEGLSGLYRGLGPILFKQVPYTMTQFATFQYSVEAAYSYILPKFFNKKSKSDLTSGQQLLVSAGGGVMAGVVSTIFSHPPDTVLSRVNMVRKADAPPPSIPAVIKELGFRGVWSGVGIRCALVGTISMGMFLLYDSVKVLTGLPTTSGVGEKAKH